MPINAPKQPPTLGSHEEAVLYFISQMDLEMVNDLLNDAYTYQTYSKAKFISLLEELFEQFRLAGDTYLLIFPGNCNYKVCDNFKTPGYLFLGNHSKNYFNLLVELYQNESVLDLYECTRFNPTFPPKLELGQRFLLDFIPDDGLPF
jgi:hypothetical protein